MPRKSNQRKAYEKIKKALDAAKLTLDENGILHLGKVFAIDSVVRVHENKDGTVDGELLLRDIPKGLPVRRIFIAMSRVIKRIPKVWVENGVRRFTAFNPRLDKEEEIEVHNYERWRGMVAVGTYPTLNHAASFETAKYINQKMRGKRRRKAEQIYTRLHWNRRVFQPERR